MKWVPQDILLDGFLHGQIRHLCSESVGENTQMIQTLSVCHVRSEMNRAYLVSRGATSKEDLKH